MKIVFLGDVHGNFVHCNKVALENPDAKILQIGDLGVGFVQKEVIEKLPDNFHFFCGNHDKRSESYSIKSCVGDYGQFGDNVFFLSGADSIDKQYRIYGVSWWPDEELTYLQLSQAIEDWTKSKCEILVCHDAPQSIAQAAYGINDTTRTRNALQSMLEARKPKMVVYGHHHVPRRFQAQGIELVGLGIDETFVMNTAQNI